jgi:hypothetical protein
MNSFGTFSEPPSLYVGDPYTDRKISTPREKGRNMVTSPAKKGQTPDVYFSKKVESIYVGEKYEDMSKIEAKARLKEAEQNVGMKPFIPSSPPKKGRVEGTHVRYSPFLPFSGISLPDLILFTTFRDCQQVSSIYITL